MNLITKYLFTLLVASLTFLGIFSRGEQIFPENQAESYLPLVFKNYVKGFSNPGFEHGSQDWDLQSNQGDDVVSSAAAYTGSYSAVLGDGSSNRSTSVSQLVKIPDSAYVVQYFQWMQTQEACPGTSQVRVLVNNQPYQHYGICKVSTTGQWGVFKIYLAPYKGQVVDFRLEFTSSGTSGNILYVDDFSFTLP